MKGVQYLLGVFLLLGFVQCDVITRHDGPAIIEDLRRASGSRIVAGWPAYDGQLPHHVNLRTVSGTGGVSLCGGSVIHHQWILTAAHCLAKRFTFLALFGPTNVTRPDFVIESSLKYIHPKYDEITAGVQTHDIGLLGIDYHVPYGPRIQPIRLQSSQQKNINYDGVLLTVSGHGRTDDWWLGGEVSEVLLWTHLRGMSNEDCLTWYPYSQVIKEQTICAGYYNDTMQTSCMGDSGGPLTEVDFDGKLTLIGIVSFGHAAGCRSPHPAGYVRPGHYHDWFTEVTGINFDWSLEESQDQPITLDLNQAENEKVIVVDHM